MSEPLAIIIRLLTPFISALCQLLLKSAADDPRCTGLRAYLNARVIFGYGLFFLCMVLNTVTLGHISLTLSGVLDAGGYLYVMLLSHWVLKEKISRRCLIGNLLILAGIAITLFL